MPSAELGAAALRRLQAPPRRRQVRRVRRDRHRQPGQERHPLDGDHVLARRRDRDAEPLGADARQHAAATRCCCSAGRTPTCRSCRSAGASASPRPGTSAATTTRRTSRSRSSIFVPENAQYYAAFGAVLYGLHEPAEVGAYKGIDGLKRVHRRRAARRKPRRDRRPAARPERRASSRRSASTTRSRSSSRRRSSRARWCAASSASTAARPRPRRCSSTRTANILKKAYQLSQGQPDPGHEGAPRAARRPASTDQGATLEVLGFGATGYAADVLEEYGQADVNIVETVAHMMSRRALLRRRRRHLRHRRAGHQGPVHAERRHQELPPVEPVLGRQRHAAAGDGRPVRRARSPSTPTTAFEAELAPKFSYGCAVFLDTDRVNFQKEGYSKEELLAGLAQVLPKNVWQYVVQIPRLASLGKQVRAAGRHAVQPRGGQGPGRLHQGARARAPRSSCTRTRGEAGAIGAAIETLRVVKRRGNSTFIGIDAAIDLEYTTKNDESTALPLLPEQLHAHVHRHRHAPTAAPPATSAGFSCEKGTVEIEGGDARARRRAQEAGARSSPTWSTTRPSCVPALLRRRRRCPRRARPMKDIEVTQGPCSAPGGVEVERGLPALRRRRRGSDGAGCASASRACSTSTRPAPFFRTYFEALGIPKQNVVFCDETTEEMWVEGGKYGSIDPCYPSQGRRRRTSTTCSSTTTRRRSRSSTSSSRSSRTCRSFVQTAHGQRVAARSSPARPTCMKAAFTKEVDFFAAARHRRTSTRRCPFDRAAPAASGSCSSACGHAPRHHRGRERLRLPTRRSKALRKLRRATCRSKGRAILETVEAREPRRDPDARPARTTSTRG